MVRPHTTTTFTTFCDLAPMIFETSRQARFIVPMALSLGFGILFATVNTLILVPYLYLIFVESGIFAKQTAGNQSITTPVTGLRIGSEEGIPGGTP
jgi:Cu/Ag efflux pump CusA